MKAINLLLISCLIVSCRSSRVTEQNTVKTDVIENRTQTGMTTVNEAELTKLLVLDNSEVFDSINEQVTTMHWSEPDSAGRQYVKTTTIIERSGNKKSQNNTKTILTNKSGTSAIEVGYEVSDVKTAKESTSNITAEQKKKTPGWIIVSSIIFTVGVVILIYLVLKRFKIVK